MIKHTLNTFYSMNSSLKKMDDFTINKILLSNKVTKDSFIGVFSSDTLPSYAQTGYYVVNLDTSQQPRQSLDSNKNK